MAWDDPASGVACGDIVTGDSAITKMSAELVANSSARSTNADFDKCYSESSNDGTGIGAFDSLT